MPDRFPDNHAGPFFEEDTHLPVNVRSTDIGREENRLYPQCAAVSVETPELAAFLLGQVIQVHALGHILGIGNDLGDGVSGGADIQVRIDYKAGVGTVPAHVEQVIAVAAGIDEDIEILPLGASGEFYEQGVPDGQPASSGEFYEQGVPDGQPAFMDRAVHAPDGRQAACGNSDKTQQRHYPYNEDDESRFPFRRL